ncbi:response regulator transcription factor [Phytohabitans aurantiacus]|uniref:response regulator transcription factor n=1 Tax=Phytohabitans aurantiacus TaxID=3016789 RepID=UPI00249245C5|nr:response regulator transcription factor [Phytohabitans aurantiacus]
MTRVLVVDDHPVTRDGVRASLERAGSAVVVAEAADGAAARALVESHRPEVVLVDLRLAGESGLDLVQYLAGHPSAVRILVLSQASPDEVLAAIRAGAHGYVSKSAATAELAEAIRAVRDGPVLPPELAARLVGEFQRPGRLTAREREVLRYVAKGHDNLEIAGELGISVRTVNRHLESIRLKVGRRRRSELIRFARAERYD